MATLIKIDKRYINLDQVKSIAYYDSDASIRVFFNDDGESNNINYMDFFGEEAAALKYYIDRVSDDPVKGRAEQIENQRRADCVKNNICPDCGQPLMVEGEFDGECTACGFNKWA